MSNTEKTKQFEAYRKRVEAETKKSYADLSHAKSGGLVVEPFYWQRSQEKFIGQRNANWKFGQNFLPTESGLRLARLAIDDGIDFIRVLQPTEEQLQRFVDVIDAKKIRVRSPDQLNPSDKMVQLEYDPVIGGFERYLSTPINKDIFIEASALAENGANVTQQLAFGLALLSKIDTISTVRIEFAVSHFFAQEIAKLRAWRLLFRAFCEASQISPKMRILAVTQRSTMASFDMHTNMIRQSIAALAGVSGGIDALTIQPFDFNFDNESSQKQARHLNALLVHESSLANVSDPLHGSYAIEQMTNDYFNRAWNLFLEIEKEGGLLRQHDALLQILNTSRSQCLTDYHCRKNTVVGVTEFQNIHESAPEKIYEQAFVSKIEKIRAAVLAANKAKKSLRIAVLPFADKRASAVKMKEALPVLRSLGLQFEILPYEEDDLEDAVENLDVDILILAGLEVTYEAALGICRHKSFKTVLVHEPGDELSDIRAMGAFDCLYKNIDLIALAERWQVAGDE